MIKLIKEKLKQIKCGIYGHEYRAVFMNGKMYFEQCILCGKVR